MKKLVIILMVAAAATACTKEDSTIPKAALGSKIEATYEKEVLFQEDVSVKISKIEDSRCPKSVVCVWAGMVKLYLSVSDKNTTKEVTIDFLADKSKPATTTVELGSQKYEIVISEVLPTPDTPGEIPLKDYKVSLTMKKL